MIKVVKKNEKKGARLTFQDLNKNKYKDQDVNINNILYEHLP